VLSKAGKLRFLIDTGAEISVAKGASLKPKLNYESTKGINIKGISDSLLKTEGTTTLRLFTSTHETTHTHTHTFHILVSDFGCQYDGILGQDFWKDETSNYCNCTVTMGELTMNFDDENDKTINVAHKLTLKTRTENMARLTTKSKGRGLISKQEIIPGVYLAESLTEEING
jgi:hypothetical protein